MPPPPPPPNVSILKPMLILYTIDLCPPSFNGAGWETNSVGQLK